MRKILGLVLIATSSLVCASPKKVVVDRAPVDLSDTLAIEAADKKELVFPPPQADGRRARRDLPSSFSGRDGELPTVSWFDASIAPKLGVYGGRFQISFTHAMQRPGVSGVEDTRIVPAKPKTVVLSPALSGKARWLNAHTLEFSATKAPKLGQKYEVRLGALKTHDGRDLASWVESFTAQKAVAGKVLEHVPTPGKPRAVAISPGWSTATGPRATFHVLFDQRVAVKTARKLITFKDEEGKAVPVAIGRMRAATLDGVKVDPRLAVRVRPLTALSRHKTYTLAAWHRDDSEALQPVTRSIQVAPKLEMESVGCGYYSGSKECEWKDAVLTTSGDVVHVVFNNLIATPDGGLGRHVSVTPKVKNLRVVHYGWDKGRVVITGGFEPSTKYRFTVWGLKDEVGGYLRKPVRFAVKTKPMGASVTMPEGVLVLDEKASKAFEVTSRNVESAELVLWPVAQNDAKAFRAALESARTRSVPTTEPAKRIPFAPKGKPNRLSTTKVNLLGALDAGRSYLATVAINELAHDANPVEHPRGSEAARPPVALVTPGDARALAVNARRLPDATVVHVGRIQGGAPVAGAKVRVLGRSAPEAEVETDANGVAVVRGGGGDLLSITAADASLDLPLDGAGVTSNALFPELGGKNGAGGAVRALVVTDRGIYRPGATVEIKGTLRQPASGGRLSPVAGADVTLRALGPTDEEVWSKSMKTSASGGAAARFAIPRSAKLGRHRIEIAMDGADRTLASAVVQVAEFRPPRFLVDVAAGTAAGGKIDATVKARYLFGAPMSGAPVRWTLTRHPAQMPRGKMTARGLHFRPARHTWLEGGAPDAWTRTGDATLDEAGTLDVRRALATHGAVGPQKFVLEAEVSDESNQHIAGRGAVTVHPVKRYAGLKAEKRWVATGSKLPVSLGVIDTRGKSVVGSRVTARLERLSWHYAARRGAGGAVRYEWKANRRAVGSCQVESAATPRECKLALPRSGEYEIVAEVDGRRGGSTRVWAWSDEAEQARAVPSRGRTVEIVTDRGSYASGDTARLLVQSPFADATAVLTLEQGGLLRHDSRRVKGGAAVFEVPLEAEHAPWVHATVTLLPLRSKGEARLTTAREAYKIGAVRLPVSLDASRLQVTVSTDRESYRPGDEATIVVDVSDGGKPDTAAEIALAVVDEGVLRLTKHRAPDPVEALRPGLGLQFALHDSRKGLAALLERSHVAGGGGMEGQTLHSPRRRFVKTALWRPSLRTNDEGRARVKFTLPDNLTEFRVMAVAVDDDGNGGKARSSFTVKKPVQLIPAVPRFATVGDRFEAAAMAHNNTSAPIDLDITLGAEHRAVTVPAGGKKRVGFEITADQPGKRLLKFTAVRAPGRVLDSVEVGVPVKTPGVDEHPRLQGAFIRSREIALRIPERAVGTQGDQLTIQVGQRLAPELGARLEYLLDYPHGCVEQTTSSTLPLLSAREILPRIGVTRFGDGGLVKKIRAGLDRLASMRTASGGLGYWPGESTPNVYGTAYAMRAVVLSKLAGIEPPPGLLEGMRDYLGRRLHDESVSVEVRAAIAQSLAELEALPVSAADALYETRDKQGMFGLASLAIALGTLPRSTGACRRAGEQDRKGLRRRRAPRRAAEPRRLLVLRLAAPVGGAGRHRPRQAPADVDGAAARRQRPRTADRPVHDASDGLFAHGRGRAPAEDRDRGR